MVAAICRVIRPTFSEVMEMDIPLAEAVLCALPHVDGADGILRAFSKIAPR